MPLPTPAAVAAAVVLSAAIIAGCDQSNAPEAQIESTAPPSPGAAQKLVGPGCSAYAEKYATGPGSVAELAKQTAAEAIEDHPVLTRLWSALSGELNERVNLSEQLGTRRLTVFAPTDDAFRAKVPEQWERTLAEPGSADALTDLLEFHLVEGERAPSELAESVETQGGEKLAVERDGDRIRIGNQANVVCGGLRTANATIYLIDSVLMPPAQATPSPSPSATP